MNEQKGAAHFDGLGRWQIENYGRKPVFSSFLPGIAGAKGIPLWCYYNNRGQAVCSFGAGDKDHSIMEFSPAHVAYQTVGQTGFRTFIKRGGKLTEPFADGCGTICIGANELEITWKNEEISVSALYFVLPGAPVGALARVLRVTNLAAPAELEILDGMPALVPYGVDQDSLKNMTQLATAWMQAEDYAQGAAYYRVRASMADSAVVTMVEGGNFALCLDAAGSALPMIVQPEKIFGYDTALQTPVGFAQTPLQTLLGAKQVASNLFPCAFSGQTVTLQTGESTCQFALYGQAENKEKFHAFAATVGGADWFAKKRAQANALTDALTAAVATKTADPVFDAYCRQDYLDNLLRGGVPTVFESEDGKNRNVFYLYSRKHGDPEREYNYFRMAPEYYSQGNGNFRDVAQNRRCDVLFEPRVGTDNVHLFFDLLQSDGYNPLVIEPMTYHAGDPGAALAALAPQSRPEAEALLNAEFTPGQLAMAAENWQFVQGMDAARFTGMVLATAKSEPNAVFTEGYWSDHWTYSLDLMESYLAVYPENKHALLLEDKTYLWYETRALVLPRTQRYRNTKNGLRQYAFLDTQRKAASKNKWMHTGHGTGPVAQSTLMEKLVLLCAIKYATLDPAGMGVEMEGGKPGWYDALNGLPGLFGSAVTESCELARLLAFTATALEQDAAGEEIVLYSETAALLRALAALGGDAQADAYARWDAANILKEGYRTATADGVAGDTTALPAAEVAAALRGFEGAVRAGIARATALNGGICPAYFYFVAEDVQPRDGGLMPGRFTPVTMPLFLEGPTRCLKLAAPAAQKAAQAAAVKESALYDTKLAMYKVNEDMTPLTFEAGRARAFTRGWLENESIWLHMEYKYILELLKSGLYPQFDEAFCAAAVPFLNPDTYGRSPLENVSFLASSANPDVGLHGRGFVARLSGSTAEFLQMWQWMLFGPTPFTKNATGLALSFCPHLPARLLPADGKVEATFLGRIPVQYHFNGTTAGRWQPSAWLLTMQDGTTGSYSGPALPDAAARAVRGGQVAAMALELTPAE
ncbi:MAG: hypothetical protein PHO10_01605 [Gemmiger sp.]|nr:hypothetical protein [Gemmiger sp.]